MKNIARFSLFVLLTGTLYFSCDTEDTVEPNFEDYFVKYYGEEGNQQGVDIEVLSDGYLLVGNTRRTAGQSGIFIVRTDLQGNRISSGTLQKPDADLVAVDAALDNGGDLIIAAEYRRSYNDIDFYAARFNLGASNGELTPSSEFTGPQGGVEPAGTTDIPESVTVLSSGDIIITGSTNNTIDSKPGGSGPEDLTDILALRLTPDLTLRPETEWRRIYGQNKADYGHRAIERDNGLLFFSSSFYSNEPLEQQGLNMMVYSTNNIGVVQDGYKTYGSTSDEIGSDIIATSEGGALLVAEAQGRILLTRLSASNSIVGFPTAVGKSNVEAKSAFEAVNGGYLVIGNWSNLNNQDFYLAKVSIENEVEWERTFGGLDEDNVPRVIQKADGSVLLVGTILLESQEKMCLIKLNPAGDLAPLSE